MTARRWILVAVAGIAVLLLAARGAARLYVDYQWYDALGAAEIWRERVASLAVLRLLAGGAAFAFVFANLYAVRHSVASIVFPRRVANLEIGEQVPARFLMSAVVVLSLALAALLALMLDDWTSFSLARTGVPFGETDPYFIADLGFFVYWLPFEEQLYYWTLIGSMIVTAVVVFSYALTPSLRWDRGRLYVSGYVRRHLTVLAGVVLLLLAWSFRLEMYETLLASGARNGAFGYVDNKVLIPGDLILAIATLGAALIVVFAGWTGQGRLASAAIFGVLGLALVARQIAPLLVERSGTPQERDARERPYAATRAGYTRRAFAADAIHPGDSSARFATLADAVPAVPLWDGAALVRALDADRRVDTSAVVGWRAAGGTIVADVASRLARAGDSTRAAFAYARVLAAQSDERGGIVRAGGEGRSEDAQLSPAVVYPGAHGFVLAADTAGRIAATPIESPLARAAYAFGFQRLRWLAGGLPAPHPVVVDERDVRTRLRRLVPFFAQGSTVTPIVLGDSLLFVVDLYAASSTYPLADHQLLAEDDRTYFQHAATAMVLASSGETRLVGDSIAGPLATSWLRRFPGVFTRWNAIAPALRAAMPPAVDMLRAQAFAYAHFEPHAEGELTLPAVDGADSALAGAAPLLLTPARDATMAVQVLLDNVDRVRGLLVARGGASRTTAWFPLAAPGPAWTTVLDRLQDADSARTSGATTRGPVRAIPVGGMIVFLQPSYAWRPQVAPAIARIAVWLGDTVRVAPTLAALVGVHVSDSLITSPATPGDERARAAQLYAAMRDALRRGDWAAFGRAFDSLGAVLAPAARRRP